MLKNPISSPPPDLRIVGINDVLPHETSDEQRSIPLMRRLKQARHFTNPPVVAAIDSSRFVLLDGANRHYSMKQLDFAHILVQVVDYESDFIELGVWQHIVSDWDGGDFMRQLEAIAGIDIRDGWESSAVAQVLLRGGPVYSIHAGVDDFQQRNLTLRRVVESYHHHAKLYRTPLTDPTQIWSLYPSGIALVMFPLLQAGDIIAAAERRAFFPPGVSRHIIHGRALKLNYPMEALRSRQPLDEKNRSLEAWLRQRLADRSVRYYAEATYQFDE